MILAKVMTAAFSLASVSGGRFLAAAGVVRAAAAAQPVWTAQPFNRWAVIAATLFVLLALKDTLLIAPHVWRSFTRWRWALTIENSMRLVRARSVSAISLLPALALVYSRYWGVEWGRFTGAVHMPEWLVPLAAVAAFIILRHILYLVAAGARRPSSLRLAHRSDCNCVVMLAMVLLPTLGVLAAFRAPDDAVRTVLGVETLAVWLLFVLRKSQILGMSFRPLRIILYLCALELIPCGAFILPSVL